jgi:hypothetical protein
MRRRTGFQETMLAWDMYEIYEMRFTRSDLRDEIYEMRFTRWTRCMRFQENVASS